MTKEQKDAGLASVFKRDDNAQKKRKELDARERESAFVPDAYGECYPGYHELGTAVVDDDEADFTAMDSKVRLVMLMYRTASLHEQRALFMHAAALHCGYSSV